MSSSKMDISEKLIEGYVKCPPTFQELAITKLAIYLCQHIELKKFIIFQTEQLQMHEYNIEKIRWDKSIENLSSRMCKNFSLPPLLKNRLIVRIRSIALQLYSWNMQHIMFRRSPLSADSLLTISDWTAEMKLDETKIATRLVQDERIPVCQRFKIACLQCLGSFIYSLWDEISTDEREDFLHYEDSKLVQLWSYELAGIVEDFIPNEDSFLFYLVIYGITEGSRSTVFRCWSELDMILKQEILIGAAMVAVSEIHRIEGNCLMYSKILLTSQVPYLDILCFLLTQMCKEQRVAFFQEALQNSNYNILSCFLQWPYLDLLLPIIEELWNILPEEKYLDLLLSVAYKYSDECSSRNGYLDYDYGDLMVELLKETPHYFKRYVFGDNYYTDTITSGKTDLLNAMINKDIIEFRNIGIFEHIWQHVTLEEKQSFLRSKYGESFCCSLALSEHWGLLNSILRKCLHEDDIAVLKKKILKSESGKNLYFEMLMEGDEEFLNSWLNWGFQSKREIFKFILKVRFRDHRLESEEFCDFSIDIDCLDNVLKMYSPSEDARRKAKSRLAKIYSRDVCINLIRNSKWKELDKFLTCGFPSEAARKRFKKWFGMEYGMELCEYHLDCLNLQDAEQYLTWCFPSEEAAEQFRQELFFFSGIDIQWRLLDYHSEDHDIIIKFFKLSPKAILKFRKDVLFRSYSLSFLFNELATVSKNIKNIEFSDCVRQSVAVVLRWGLTDEEILVAFKDASNMYLREFSFPNEEVRQLVQLNWDKLINERLSELSVEHDANCQ